MIHMKGIIINDTYELTVDMYNVACKNDFGYFSLVPRMLLTAVRRNYRNVFAVNKASQHFQ